MTVRTLSPPGPAVVQQLPLLASGDAADLGRAGLIPGPVGIGRGALVVGRDLDQLDWLGEALLGIGLGPVVRATELASAILAFRRQSFDLLITAADLCGPDGGLLLVEWLRQKAPTSARNIPAVVLTAGCDPAWITLAGDKGISVALRYPLMINDFQARMMALVWSDSVPHRQVLAKRAGSRNEP